METKNIPILLVDDVPVNLEILTDYLENAGINVSVSTSGEEALEITKKFVPKLILMDVKMPGIDGFETCRRLKQRAALRNVPVIFISALGERIDKVKGFSARGVDYILQTFKFSDY